jgi:hypothetical protein
MTAQRQIDFGKLNRDRGIERAVAHADKVHLEWREKAYRLLKWYINSGDRDKIFMAEDVRAYADSVSLPSPPSERSWGSIIQRAAREGLIQKIRPEPVKNPKVNCAFAMTWRRVRSLKDYQK